MRIKEITINQLETERLLLVPFTMDICNNIMYNDYELLYEQGFKRGENWPDIEMMETLPKIIEKLSINNYVTGFESWLIIRKDTREIIGDAGFKGFNFEFMNVDIGYAIIEDQRKKGFAYEATSKLIEWAFSQELVREITAKSFSDNDDSINLLKKLGFEPLLEHNDLIDWSLKRS